MSRTRTRCGALVMVVGLATSCGVPTGPESFEPIDGADVPNLLDDVATTTTTTTTTTTIADLTETTTTTIPEPEPLMENVDVYFVSRQKLAPKPTQVLAPVTATELIDLLEAGPSSDLLDNEIAVNLIESVSEENGVLTIALNDVVFQRIPLGSQRVAVAQIVLTFLNALTGVGSVEFTIDGDRQSVPIERNGVSDEPVSRDDYSELRVDADPDDSDSDADSVSTTSEPVTTEQ